MIEILTAMAAIAGGVLLFVMSYLAANRCVAAMDGGQDWKDALVVLGAMFAVLMMMASFGLACLGVVALVLSVI